MLSEGKHVVARAEGTTVQNCVDIEVIRSFSPWLLSAIYYAKLRTLSTGAYRL
jgi:hypothetical protein